MPESYNLFYFLIFSFDLRLFLRPVFQKLLILLVPGPSMVAFLRMKGVEGKDNTFAQSITAHKCFLSSKLIFTVVKILHCHMVVICYQHILTSSIFKPSFVVHLCQFWWSLFVWFSTNDNQTNWRLKCNWDQNIIVHMPCN